MSGEKEKTKYGEPINSGPIPSYDPKPAAKLAAKILHDARAPFAIIGRVAMWTYLPPEQQEFTKDLDVAVPAEHIAAVAEAIRSRKLKQIPLSIGGVAIRDGDIRLDFIDRRQHFAALFREAVEAATRTGKTVTVGRTRMPVVPVEYLVAMKMVSGEPKDDRDARRLLEHAQLNYRETRRIVLNHLGPATAQRLDVFAREAGRPEVPRRRKYES